MRIRGFEWDARNVGHIARHGIRPWEAEEVFWNKPVFRRGRGCYHTVYGRTEEGRYIFVVYMRKPDGIARVITARDMTPAERRYYRKQRGGR